MSLISQERAQPGLATALSPPPATAFEVEVIDAMKPPIDKACGEGLMPDSLEALAALGFDLDKDLAASESHPLRGIRFIGDSDAPPTPHRPSRLPARSRPRHPSHRPSPTPARSRHQPRRSLPLGKLRPGHRTAQPKAPSSTPTVKPSALATSSVPTAPAPASPPGPVSPRCLVHSRRIGLRQHYTIAPWTDFVEVYWSDARSGLRHPSLLHRSLRRLHRQPKNPHSRAGPRSLPRPPRTSRRRTTQRLPARLHHPRPHPSSRHHRQHRPRRRRLRLRRRHHRRRPRPLLSVRPLLSPQRSTPTTSPPISKPTAASSVSPPSCPAACS